MPTDIYEPIVELRMSGLVPQSGGVPSAVVKLEDGHVPKRVGDSIVSTPLTATPVLPTTTKGDVIVHNGTTNARLGVGANGQRLTADSTQTTGLKWTSTGVDKTFNWDGAGSAPAVDTGAVAPVVRATSVNAALLIAYDDAGDRASDTVTISVFRVNAAGTEVAMGTISLSAASYNHDTTLSGWSNTTLAAGDTIKAKLTTAGTTATRITLGIKVDET